MIPSTAAAARSIYENNADNSARFVLGGAVRTRSYAWA